MDSLSEQNFYEALTKVKGKTTILIVTHDTSYVSNLTDRVLCVGEASKNGHISDVVQHPLALEEMSEERHVLKVLHNAKMSHSCECITVRRTMSSFFSALFDPNMPFVRNALIAGLLSSILFGIIGTVVTVKRIASLAGAISHAVLGGIGLALYISATGIIPSLPPLAGAIIFAILAAIIIAVVSLKAKQREDTVINAIWAVGMSIGGVSMAKTPGYTDPFGYLFGNILLN